ncbi:hypothetical protein [Streptomyces sp. NPDC127098]|uniref:hypothetical protein n=1 Tax=Streptomyces sp. NPDC127098 TaxID=3347137 RepID=UPI003662FE0C
MTRWAALFQMIGVRPVLPLGPHAEDVLRARDDLEDALQQVRVKLLAAGADPARARIRNPAAWLSVVASRVAADWRADQRVWGTCRQKRRADRPLSGCESGGDLGVLGVVGVLDEPPADAEQHGDAVAGALAAVCGATPALSQVETQAWRRS